MNRILTYIFTLLIFSSCSTFSNSNEELIQMYDEAYQYIKKSSIKKKYCQETLNINHEDCKITVADSTVFMGYSIFTNKFIEMAEDKSDAEVIRSIYQLDRKRKKDFESISVLEKLNNYKSKDISSNLGLFFSTPYKNTLMVEALNKYGPGKSYQDLTQFNSGIIFLFFFNSNGNIKKVFKEIIHYN